jgi:hypothetical protein
MSTGESQSSGEGDTGGGRLKARLDRWLDSDLVGIPATLYTFAVLAISLAVFRFGGPIAGLVVAALLWIPMVLFAIQGRGKPPIPIDVTAVAEGPLHRVLVIANEGLEDPALCREVCRRSDRTATEAMILAPVVASSRLGELADDVDAELSTASSRVDAAVRALQGEGVRASGRTNIASPMESLSDGLREFPPNEIVMLPGREADWDAAGDLAERVRAETGLPVTAVGHTAA